jgi:hypothetical protein
MQKKTHAVQTLIESGNAETIAERDDGIVVTGDEFDQGEPGGGDRCNRPGVQRDDRQQ